MSLESAAREPKKHSFAALGFIIGAGIALLLSEIGLEVEMAVGMVLGLCIGTGIDEWKK